MQPTWPQVSAVCTENMAKAGSRILCVRGPTAETIRREFPPKVFLIEAGRAPMSVPRVSTQVGVDSRRYAFRVPVLGIPKVVCNVQKAHWLASMLLMNLFGLRLTILTICLSGHGSWKSYLDGIFVRHRSWHACVVTICVLLYNFKQHRPTFALHSVDLASQIGPLALLAHLDVTQYPAEWICLIMSSREGLSQETLTQFSELQ